MLFFLLLICEEEPFLPGWLFHHCSVDEQLRKQLTVAPHWRRWCDSSGLNTDLCVTANAHLAALIVSAFRQVSRGKMCLPMQ